MIDSFMYFVYRSSMLHGYFGVILPGVILYQTDDHEAGSRRALNPDRGREVLEGGAAGGLEGWAGDVFRVACGGLPTERRGRPCTFYSTLY